MPVDDDVLADNKDKCRIKLRLIQDDFIKLTTLITNIDSIQMVEVPDPSDEEPNRIKRELPIDKGTGGELKTARRQELYDKTLIDAVALEI